MANPNDTPAQVTAEYLLLGGGVLTKSYTVPANGRFTIYVDAEEIPAGSGQRPLSERGAINDDPLNQQRAGHRGTGDVVARTGDGSRTSGMRRTTRPGRRSTGTRWALAEGEVGGPSGLETYVLIANTSATRWLRAGDAALRRWRHGSSVTIRSQANSRTNVSVAVDFPAAAGRKFGVIVESLGATPAQIVVERAMYSSAGGAVWAAGSNALATRLQ